MVYQLKNCQDGEKACYTTTLEIMEEDNVLTFKFEAFNSRYNCPHRGYNGLHYEGDVCEIFIGTDANRKSYYEIEISPLNDIFLAKITYKGTKDGDEPFVNVEFVKKNFISSNVTLTETGYIAVLSFDKQNIFTGEGEVFFNAYRLETDGEQSEKYVFALSPTMKKKFHVPERYVYLKDFLG